MVRLEQATAFVAAATGLPKSVTLLESVEAVRPVRLAKEAFVAFMARLATLKLAIGLAVFKCSRPLASVASTLIPFAASPSSTFFFLHPALSCASFSHSQQYTS